MPVHVKPPDPKQATRVKNRRAKQAKRLSLLMSKPYRRQHLGKAILQVPSELTSMIAEYLSLDDICSLRLTCVKFSVALTPHVASKIRGLTVAFDDAGCEEMESFVRSRSDRLCPLAPWVEHITFPPDHWVTSSAEVWRKKSNEEEAREQEIANDADEIIDKHKGYALVSSKWLFCEELTSMDIAPSTEVIERMAIALQAFPRLKSIHNSGIKMISKEDIIDETEIEAGSRRTPVMIRRQQLEIERNRAEVEVGYDKSTIKARNPELWTTRQMVLDLLRVARLWSGQNFPLSNLTTLDVHIDLFTLSPLGRQVEDEGEIASRFATLVTSCTKLRRLALAQQNTWFDTERSRTSWSGRTKSFRPEPVKINLTRSESYVMGYVLQELAKAMSTSPLSALTNFAVTEGEIGGDYVKIVALHHKTLTSVVINPRICIYNAVDDIPAVFMDLAMQMPDSITCLSILVNTDSRL